MPVCLTASLRRPSPTSGRRRGFTLMEILVVIGIIVALAAISIFVGSAVKKQSTRKATLATLTTLQHVLDEYLKDNNPEPGLVNPVAASPAPAPLPGKPTNPQSDVVNYVLALRATAGAKVDKIPMGDSGTYKTFLDGFGNPIHFVPSTEPNNPVHRAYFFSPGPDGVADNDDDISSLDL
jgi:prepilin-type N-terminal cleavage/methylation domain-containing protein